MLLFTLERVLRVTALREAERLVRLSVFLTSLTRRYGSPDWQPNLEKFATPPVVEYELRLMPTTTTCSTARPVLRSKAVPWQRPRQTRHPGPETSRPEETLRSSREKRTTIRGAAKKTRVRELASRGRRRRPWRRTKTGVISWDFPRLRPSWLFGRRLLRLIFHAYFVSGENVGRNVFAPGCQPT